MNAENARNLAMVQDLEQAIDTLLLNEEDTQRAELLREAALFTKIAREGLSIGDLDRAGRALSCAKARLKEVAA